jgi:ribosomal protein S18 acetylase RimI-like enzyme
MDEILKIRRAERKDLDAILRLNHKLFEKEHKEYDNSLDLNWTYGRGAKIFSNNIINDFAAVAEINNKIIGYLAGGVSDSGSSWRTVKIAELNNMFIEEEFRNKRIGKRMVEKFVEWCKNKQIDRISVRASVQNELGIEFYKRVGFKNYDVVLEMKLSK